MSHNECPHLDECEIVEVDNEGKESTYDEATCKFEIDSPMYKCKTHGNLFFEWELKK